MILRGSYTQLSSFGEKIVQNLVIEQFFTKNQKKIISKTKKVGDCRKFFYNLRQPLRYFIVF